MHLRLAALTARRKCIETAIGAAQYQAAAAETEGAEERQRLGLERAALEMVRNRQAQLVDILKQRLDEADVATGEIRLEALRSECVALQAKADELVQATYENNARIVALRAHKVSETLGAWPELAAAAAQEFAAPVVNPVRIIIESFLTYLDTLDRQPPVGHFAAGDAGLHHTLTLLDNDLIDRLLEGGMYGRQQVQHIKLLCHNLLTRLA
jgi:hypothetical protein